MLSKKVPHAQYSVNTSVKTLINKKELCKYEKKISINEFQTTRKGI